MLGMHIQLFIFIYLTLFEINNFESFGFGSDLKFLASAQTHPSEQRRLSLECEARKLHKVCYTKSYQVVVSPYIVSPLPTKEVMRIIKKSSTVECFSICADRLS